MTPRATRSSSSLLARAVDRLLTPLLVTLAFALWPHIAYAAVITVDGATCTLPDAITAANMDGATGGCTAGSGADTLLLTAPIYPLATGPYSSTGQLLYDFDTDFYFEGMSATPSVTTTIVISGGISGGIDGAIVERSGSDLYRLFYIGEAGDLTIQHVTIRYGKATPIRKDSGYDEVGDSGGGIFNRGKLTLVDSQLFSNTAPYAGGGIYNYDSGTVKLANVTFIANGAGYEGGGFANRGTAILNNIVFTSNTAEQGGGVSNYRGLAILSDRESYRGQIVLSDSEFFSNTARYGGGLYTSGIFGGNDASTELTNVDFIANEATGGGGLYNRDTSTTILSNTNFISNTAQFGGGIGNGAYTAGTIILTNSYVISNIAEYGGGIYNANINPNGSAAIITIADSEIRANRAMSSGGGIYQQGTVSIVRSRIVDNWAGDTGGALIHLASGLVGDPGWTSIEQSCIVNNMDTAVTVVDYYGRDLIEASNNWWGAADGPISGGLGDGDSVSSGVTITPFLTSALLNCPTRATRKRIYLPHVDQ